MKDCLICNATFDDFKSINEHEVEVHEKALVCEICKLGFGELTEIRQHQKTSQNRVHIQHSIETINQMGKNKIILWLRLIQIYHTITYYYV